MSGHYLDLSANPLRFQPIGKSINVFFDEANRQVGCQRLRLLTGKLSRFVVNHYHTAPLLGKFHKESASVYNKIIELRYYMNLN